MLSGSAPVVASSGAPFFQMPRFNGSDSVHEFIRLYKKNCVRNGWDQSLWIRFLPAFLDGPARSLWDGLADEEEPTEWDSTTELLIQLFSVNDDIASVEFELFNRQQGPTERYVEYEQCILSLASRLDRTVSEAEKIRMLIRGLNDDLFRTVFMAEPRNLCDLSKVAKRCERCVMELNRRQSDKEAQISTAKQAGATRMESAVPCRPLRRRTDEMRTADGKPVCFTCNFPGHVAKFCPRRQQVISHVLSAGVVQELPQMFENNEEQNDVTSSEQSANASHNPVQLNQLCTETTETVVELECVPIIKDEEADKGNELKQLRTDEEQEEQEVKIMLKPGDLVNVIASGQKDEKRRGCGPFTVIRCVGPTTYEIATGKGRRAAIESFDVSVLRPADESFVSESGANSFDGGGNVTNRPADNHFSASTESSTEENSLNNVIAKSGHLQHPANTSCMTPPVTSPLADPKGLEVQDTKNHKLELSASGATDLTDLCVSNKLARKKFEKTCDWPPPHIRSEGSKNHVTQGAVRGECMPTARREGRISRRSKPAEADPQSRSRSPTPLPSLQPKATEEPLSAGAHVTFLRRLLLTLP